MSKPRSDRNAANAKPSARRQLTRRRRPLAETLEARTLLSLTIIVNTNADSNDLNFSAISLREAIELSNGTLTYDPATDTNTPKLVSGSVTAPAPGAPPVPNTIVFGLKGSTTIAVTGSPLPAITSPVILDGYSQAGSSVSPPDKTEVVYNTAVVRIDGLALGSPASGPGYDGLAVTAPDCMIDGLIVTGFSGAGMAIDNPASGAPAQGNWLWGNFLGALPDSASGRLFANDPVSLLNPANPQPAPSKQPGNLAAGLRITASNNRVGGNTPGLPNVIANNGFDASGNPAGGVGLLIDTLAGTGNLIQGNAILHNATQGVLVKASNNTIGEALHGGGNVIGGNLAQGVLISGTSDPSVQGNRLWGNWVGTELGTLDGKILKGTIADPNGAEGVRIQDSPKNTVGGTATAARNVIGANDLDGVAIAGATSTSNRVLNNYIGFNIVSSLIVFLPNQNGVYVTAPGNFIGDAVAGAGNTIDNNRLHGILIQGAAASGNTVAGNVIGLNPDGASAFGNAFDGVHVDNAPDNLIGGTSAAARNTISSNNNGVVIVGLADGNPAHDTATGNRVYGNFIGTAVDGLTDLGNAVDGVVLNNAPLNDVGDVTAGSGNVISGNNRGVRITGALSHDDRVRGNFIGTDLTATAFIHNEVDGVIITGGALNNAVGGTAPGAGNTIEHNVGSGVNLDDGTGNSVLGNSVYANTVAGITLNPTTRADNLQPAPHLTSVTPSGSVTNVQGTFSGLINANYTLQFFSSPTQDSPGVAQGLTPLGWYPITTDPAGSFAIDKKLNAQVDAGQFVTATITDAAGNSSAFSNALPAVPISFSLSGATYTANETDGSVVITVTRLVGVAGQFGGDVAVDYTVGGGTAVAGTDYTAVSGTLFFKATDPNTKTFTIPILNPGKVGGSVTADVTLSKPANGATLGAPASAVLTINGNSLASFGLAGATASVNENAGSLSFTVSRTSSAGTSTVSYATADGTARAGVNYRATAGTLTFNPGETSKTVAVPVLDDNSVSGPLTFDIALSNPTNGVVGATGSTLVTVNDTDTAGSIQTALPGIISAPGATSVTVQVVRVGGSAGVVSVQYAAGGGNAVPWVDYGPIAGTLLFGPGEVSKTLIIPLAHTGTPGPDSAFYFALGTPGGGATLGHLTTTVVTVRHPAAGTGVGTGTGTGNPSPTDTVPPTVLDLQPLPGPSGVFAVVVTFSKPMDPARAADVSNYGTFLFTPGRDGAFGTFDDGYLEIRAAAYDPGTRRAVLVLTSPLPYGTFARITLNANARLAPPKGLTDLSGNYLDGTGTGLSANAGSAYSAVIGEGNALTYTDRSGDTVSLRLSGPGLMALRRGADGEAQQLRVVGAAPGATALTGQVRRSRRGAGGVTTIPSIAGAWGVAIKLRPPAFRLGGISAAAVDALAGSGRLRARR